MNKYPLPRSSQRWGVIVFYFMAMIALPAQAASENPISKMARFFNADLVMLEDRLSWLEERTKTMAAFNEHPLRSGIGARGYRASPQDVDPHVMVDLGSDHSISRIFLVPAQRESLTDSGIFPKQFTVEVSRNAAFEDAEVVFTTERVDFLNPQGRPIPFEVFGVTARFIRLTVHRGHNNKGWLDVFGLSEIIAMSGDDVISFGAEVTMTSSLSSGTNWYPQALTDGRMPHGIWHSGVASTEPGDQVIVEGANLPVHWEIALEEATRIDRIVLFPYSLTDSAEAYVVSNRLVVEGWMPGATDWEVLQQWTNRPKSASCITPIVLTMPARFVERVRITSNEPWELGDLRVHALSEIEVWSEGRNVALGQTVSRTVGHESRVITNLTDGFTSESMIANIGIWLDQLHDRIRFESELTDLRPRIRSMEAESELNVTFSSAIFLGLTFMIPVLIFEKRRVEAKKRVEMMRKRIAADLHDDIGGNLGSISLIARSARRGLEKLTAPPEITNDLEEVEQIARQSSMAMRDIIWLVELRDDSVGDLVGRMQETCNRMLREVDHTFICHSTRGDSRLSLDFKRHFFLFFKEALHNILKHAKAHKVSILMEDEGDDLVLEIQDDGIGMPVEMADDPETSRKLRQRAEVMGGDFKLTTSPGIGTCIRLAVCTKMLNKSVLNT